MRSACFLMAREFVLLGCGSSGGVPRITGDWGACDSRNPKNRRTRCSLLVRQIAQVAAKEGVTRVLVDSSPDMREQLLRAATTRLDGVLYTHDHADQTHGIDDLRALAYQQRARIKVWMDAATRRALFARFGYCFQTPPNSDYPPILDAQAIDETLAAFAVAGEGGAVDVLPFAQQHGRTRSLGFRFGDVAYSSDVNDLPPQSLQQLQGLRCWIVDALRYQPHPSHFHLDKALALIDELKPQRAVLTNLHIDMDYDALRKRLPPHVEPGYDGMVIA